MRTYRSNSNEIERCQASQDEFRFSHGFYLPTCPWNKIGEIQKGVTGVVPKIGIPKPTNECEAPKIAKLV